MERRKREREYYYYWKKWSHRLKACNTSVAGY